jgi:hypothetical protein
VKRGEPRGEIFFAAFVPLRPGMNDGASRQGAAGGFVADDEMIAAQGQQRLGESQLAIAGLLGFKLVFIAEQDDLGQPFRRAHVNPHALVGLDAFGGRRAHFEKGVEALRGERQFFMADHMAAFDGGPVGAGEIQGDPLAPAGGLDGVAVDLQTAHAKDQIAGQAAHLLADRSRQRARCLLLPPCPWSTKARSTGRRNSRWAPACRRF